jgi:hypothetical protein
MYAQVEKTKENKSRAAANSVGQKKSNMKQCFGFVDNRPAAVSQKNLQEVADIHSRQSHSLVQQIPDTRKTHNEIHNNFQIVSNSNPVQRFTEEDVKFLHAQNMGLRHHDSYLSARLERLAGTKGGDAVPLNPLGARPNLGLPLMGIGVIPPEAIAEFTDNVGKFITLSLNRSVNMKLGVTTPENVVDSALMNSTFLLVSGMKGIDIPKDVDKRDYAALGKAGKQEIKPNQIVELMDFDDVGVVLMKLVHEEKWNTRVRRYYHTWRNI